MQLREMVDRVVVVDRRGDLTTTIAGITHDSRRCRPGWLFCCVPGARADGHDFAPEAIAAGASALLVERFLDVDARTAQVLVADARAAMGPIAAALYHDPARAMRVLGVTGTNGKTTTTYLLEAIGHAAGERTGVIGTVGVRVDGVEHPTTHTTPEATDLQALLATMRDAGVGVVAMEASSGGIALHRVDGTWFRAVCFTNLSHEHLDFHGTLDAYFDAKAALFDPARAAVAAVNVDDEHGRLLVERCAAAGLPVLTYAIDHDADVRAEDIAPDADGSRFRLVFWRRGRGSVVRLRLPARHNVANALAAACAALAADIPFDAVVDGLERRVFVPGRFEAIDTGQPFRVYVDYAHKPVALEHALGAARELATTRDARVRVVFGCGGDRDREKRPMMGAIAARLADQVVITSDNPRSEDPTAIAAEIEAGARGGTAEIVVELDRRAAIATALHGARPGDVVLIAGKGHETGQTAHGVTVPFDDRTVARAELEALACG